MAKLGHLIVYKRIGTTDEFFFIPAESIGDSLTGLSRAQKIAMKAEIDAVHGDPTNSHHARAIAMDVGEGAVHIARRN